MKSKVTICLSHCDDEILAGAFAAFDPSLEKRLLICSSDRTNPLRQSYRRGEEALAAVCADLGITEFRVLSDFHSEFSRLRTRGPGEGPILMDWWKAASAALEEMSEGCDAIVTEGPWGFYSHGDHLLVRRMVLSTTRLPVWWAAIKYQTSTWPMGNVDRLIPMQAVPIDEYTLDVTLYNRMRQHYVDRDAWTWDHEPPRQYVWYEECPPGFMP